MRTAAYLLSVTVEVALVNLQTGFIGFAPAIDVAWPLERDLRINVVLEGLF